MRLKKGKKIFLYFFLLIIFGSVNNISINQIKFVKIKTINITGLENKDNQKLLKDIEALNLENIFFINGSDILRILEANTLIENYKIIKKYPSTLVIDIEKTKFLAKINLDGKLFLIGSNGKLSESDSSKLDLPYIFGKPSINEFFKIKKIIDRSKVSYEKIKSLYYFKSNRWDIKLYDNILIKLSKENTNESLDNAVVILNQDTFKNIKTIDARVRNQIILNE